MSERGCVARWRARRQIRRTLRAASFDTRSLPPFERRTVYVRTPLDPTTYVPIEVHVISTRGRGRR